MKKLLIFPFFLLLLCTGCARKYLIIGDLYAPTAMDERERVYVDVPQQDCDKILYRTFYMDWRPDAGFRLYKAENAPLYAVWRLMDLPANHAAFGTVFYKTHELTEFTQDALAAYAGNAIRDAITNAGIAVIDHRVEKIEFSDIPAIKVVCVYHNQDRTMYSIQSTIVFFCPEDPEHFIYYLSWFQRGPQATYLDPQTVAAGEGFFRSFHLR